MLYIHAHNSRHNLINHYDYAVNSYSCSLWNHLLDPIIPLADRTAHQDILYNSIERMLLWESATKDFANYLKRNIKPDTRKPVYAVHPFSSTIPDDYESVCADFGYSLERVVHPWNSLTTEALWAVAAEFNWCAYSNDGFESSIARDSNDWYAKLFSKDYTLAEWTALQAPKL